MYLLEKKSKYILTVFFIRFFLKISCYIHNIKWLKSRKKIYCKINKNIDVDSLVFCSYNRRVCLIGLYDKQISGKQIPRLVFDICHLF